MSDEGHETHCPVDGCPGDYHYAPPGRGHTCTTETWLTAQAPAGAAAAADDEAVEALLPPVLAEWLAAADDKRVQAPEDHCRDFLRALLASEAFAEHVEQQAREREAGDFDAPRVEVQWAVDLGFAITRARDESHARQWVKGYEDNPDAVTEGDPMPVVVRRTVTTTPWVPATPPAESGDPS